MGGLLMPARLIGSEKKGLGSGTGQSASCSVLISDFYSVNVKTFLFLKDNSSEWL